MTMKNAILWITTPLRLVAYGTVVVLDRLISAFKGPR